MSRETPAQSSGRCLTHYLRFGALLAFFTACSIEASATEAVKAVRIWPAQEYTRLTIESAGPISYTLSLIADPDRLVLDLQNIDHDSLKAAVEGKLIPGDPNIRGLRTGQFKQNVVRVVLELTSEVKPQAFALKPIGEYGHRLVVDVYPANPPDPLLALLRRNEQGLELPGQETTRETKSWTPQAAPTQGPAGATSKPDAKAPPPTADRSGKPLPLPSKILPSRTFTIAIDAGHGGEDPGARGARGTWEKDVTLTIAKRLAGMIAAEQNMRAVLTREDDFFVPLQTRVEKARRVRADLFVSIHADAFIHPHARGSTVFALSERGATSVAANWIAKRENDADLIGGVSLNAKDRHVAQTLLDLSQTATINDSLKLGRSVLKELGGVNALHKQQVEQAGFAVLKAPDIPSILVELAFITNPDEEKKLGDKAHQNRLARAIIDGIRRYFATNPGLNRSTLAANDSPHALINSYAACPGRARRCS